MQIKDDRSAGDSLAANHGCAAPEPDVQATCKGQTMTQPDNPKSWTDSLPFPRHWLGYIAIKLLVIALAVFLALRWEGVL